MVFANCEHCTPRAEIKLPMGWDEKKKLLKDIAIVAGGALGLGLVIGAFLELVFAPEARWVGMDISSRFFTLFFFGLMGAVGALMLYLNFTSCRDFLRDWWERNVRPRNITVAVDERGLHYHLKHVLGVTPLPRPYFVLRFGLWGKTCLVRRETSPWRCVDASGWKVTLENSEGDRITCDVERALELLALKAWRLEDIIAWTREAPRYKGEIESWRFFSSSLIWGIKAAIDLGLGEKRQRPSRSAARIREKLEETIIDTHKQFGAVSALNELAKEIERRRGIEIPT